MTFSGSITTANKVAGLVALVGTIIAGFGLTFVPPWPTRSDFNSLKTTIEAVQTQQTNQINNAQKQTCIILQLLKDRYLKEQNDAQEELNKAPNSPTLQRARDQAKEYVEYFELEQRTARCRHLQAPISSSTAPEELPDQWIMAPSQRSLRLMK